MAKIRLEELSRYSRKILVMCPICFISLSRYADEYNVEIKDLAELLR
jgi:Fe-S oxidoreductase